MTSSYAPAKEDAFRNNKVFAKITRQRNNKMTEHFSTIVKNEYLLFIAYVFFRQKRKS
jgi:ABC-type long-subunit fatty acid transport system fused permease/ATPase subunit